MAGVSHESGDGTAGQRSILFLLESGVIARPDETIYSSLTWSCITTLNDREAEPAMDSRITNQSEQIDRKTSRSICDAVGERLQQDLRLGPPSSHLRHLMDELRQRDNENVPNSSN